MTHPTVFPVDAGRPLACANTYPPKNLPREPRIPLTRDAALPLQLHGERHQNVISVPDIRGSAKKVLYFVFSVSEHIFPRGAYLTVPEGTAGPIDWPVSLPPKSRDGNATP